MLLIRRPWFALYFQAKHTAPTDSNTLREATDDEDIAGLVSDDPILPPPASPVSRSNSALLDSGLVQQLMDDQVGSSIIAAVHCLPPLAAGSQRM